MDNIEVCDGIAKIPLDGKWGQGKFLLLNEEDTYILNKYKIRLLKNGYVCCYRQINKKQEHSLIHRIVLDVNGRFNFVDHINDNKLDNTRNNLRLCTNKQNVSRKRKIDGFSSIYKGVCWKKDANKWYATITHNYKQVYIGSFSNQEDAAKAYDKKALELFGDFARTNIYANSYE